MKKKTRQQNSEPAKDTSLYPYQQSKRYFAQIAQGLEPLAKNELARLGAQEINEGYRGLYFVADNEALYRINYASRFIQKKFTLSILAAE